MSTTVEVVRNSVEGWDVRQRGAEASQSNYPSRETAIEAAEKAVEVGEADEYEVIDEDEEVTEVAEDDPGFRKAVIIFAAMMIAVIALIALLSAVGIST